jgi:hypothetical protein
MVPATILHKLTIAVGKKTTMTLPWPLFDNTDTNKARIHTHREFLQESSYNLQNPIVITAIQQLSELGQKNL